MLSITRGDANEVQVAEPAPLDERYTVLLLDESQLDRFLQRPGMRSIDRRISGTTVDVLPIPRTRRLWFAGGIAGALAVWIIVWLRASSGDAASAPAPTVTDLAPTVATGASFSVTVASFVRDSEARALETRLETSGLPAFAWRIDVTKRQVLLGPYVSIDEAEAAQRLVAAQGYRRTRLYVDERLRSTTALPASFAPDLSASSGMNPDVLLVAAPGLLSLVFELSEEPRQVSGRRVSSTSFEVDAGPLLIPARAQQWKAPADIQLVKQVSVEPAGTPESPSLRARVMLAEGAQAAVRVTGTRVYVDVSRAQAEIDDVPAAPDPMRVDRPRTAQARQVPAPTASAPEGAAVVTAPSEDEYRAAIRPVIARFEEIQPFLRAAVTSPNPDVLAALGGTFLELEQSVRATEVPLDSAAFHGLLASAVQLAKTAVAPEFRGDRVAQAREAAAQFAAAKVRLPN